MLEWYEWCAFCNRFLARWESRHVIEKYQASDKGTWRVNFDRHSVSHLEKYAWAHSVLDYRMCCSSCGASKSGTWHQTLPFVEEPSAHALAERARYVTASRDRYGK